MFNRKEMQEDNTPKITDNNGQFLIGNKGKPKGAVNKTTKQLKEFIVSFLNDKAFEIPLIWDSLTDKDKLIVFIQLSKLVLPKANEDAPELIEERERVKNEPTLTFPIIDMNDWK